MEKTRAGGSFPLPPVSAGSKGSCIRFPANTRTPPPSQKIHLPSANSSQVTSTKDCSEKEFKLRFTKEKAFSAQDIDKLWSCTKLRKLVVSDPKTAKRMLANRKSAQRFKDKKNAHITGLQEQVKTLEEEKASMFAKLTCSERERIMLIDENKSLKSQIDVTKILRDEIENLKAMLEIQQLKITRAEQMGVQSMDHNMLIQPNNDQTSEQVPDLVGLDQFGISNMECNMFIDSNNGQQDLLGGLNQLNISSMQPNMFTQHETNLGGFDPFSISNGEPMNLDMIIDSNASLFNFNPSC